MKTVLDQYLAVAIKEICQRKVVSRRKNDEYMRCYPTTSTNSRADNSYDRISLEDEYGQ